MDITFPHVTSAKILLINSFVFWLEVIILISQNPASRQDFLAVIVLKGCALQKLTFGFETDGAITSTVASVI